jgi:hypothetical protein
MTVFIEKPPVTSSYKKASILFKLGTNVHWAIVFVTANSVSMARGDISKLPKSLFCVDFSIKTDFKVLQLLNRLRLSHRLFSVGNTLP